MDTFLDGAFTGMKMARGTGYGKQNLRQAQVLL
jgi:hypothetical protein